MPACIAALAATSSDASWRQTFHIASATGLVNDPNGLIHWNGYYHVFLQWNPDGCTHANKHWAHVRSPDLVNWEWLPAALAPDRPYDARGCYSGSAVADNGRLCLLYSGNAYTADGHRISSQCLAISDDGTTFDKRGPVIAGPPDGFTAHFRDPKVWRHDGRWLMVLGAQTEALQGTVLLLASDDLNSWSLAGPLLEAGRHGYMCECPDLFSLDGQDVLLFCEQRDGTDSPNTAGYVVGALDPERPGFTHGSFRRLDSGRDFYAPQTCLAPDGRRLLVGWMGLPEETSCPTVEHGWMHSLTLPRELSLADGALVQKPATELRMLRGKERSVRALTVTGRLTVDAPGHRCEIELSVQDGWEHRWFLDLRCTDGGARTTLTIDPNGDDHGTGEITLDAFGDAQCGHDSVTARRIGRAPMPSSGINHVQVFVDGSSVEVFLNGGAIVMTAKIYPDPDAKSIRLRTDGTVTFGHVSVWPLGRHEAMEPAGERFRPR